MSQQHTLGKTSTTVRSEGDGHLSVVYHATEVVKRENGVITLDTGGWKTATTKTRMNQASSQFGLGYNVFQKNHEWFVDYEGKTLPFDGDKITL